MNKSLAVIFTCGLITFNVMLFARAGESVQSLPTKATPAFYVYDFYATWCSNCTAIEPIINTIKDKYKGLVKIVAIDIDAPKNQKIVQDASVSSVPTLFIVDKNGKSLKTFVGADEAQQIEQELSHYLKQSAGFVSQRQCRHI